MWNGKNKSTAAYWEENVGKHYQLTETKRVPLEINKPHSLWFCLFYKKLNNGIHIWQDGLVTTLLWEALHGCWAPRLHQALFASNTDVGILEVPCQLFDSDQWYLGCICHHYVHSYCQSWNTEPWESTEISWYSQTMSFTNSCLKVLRHFTQIKHKKVIAVYPKVTNCTFKQCWALGLYFVSCILLIKFLFSTVFDIWFSCQVMGNKKQKTWNHALL